MIHDLRDGKDSLHSFWGRKIFFGQETIEGNFRKFEAKIDYSFTYFEDFLLVFGPIKGRFLKDLGWKLWFSW
jgi:hypothetical protein